MNKRIYLEEMLRQMPRLLGQINANPASCHFGCADRVHWHNNLTPCANARFQESVLTLAVIYQTPQAKDYYQNPHILKLINASLNFWQGIQDVDGSFNEWYPHEGSFVATSFSCYAVSETLRLLGKEKIENYQELVQALVKGVKWIGRHQETLVCNQQTGALAAVYNVFLLTGEVEFKAMAERLEDIIISCQKDEGWFLEYGGVDIGYLSLSIDYLSKYVRLSGSSKMKSVVLKALKFMVHFIHQDGTSGGVYTSRDTEYLMPHGFELLAHETDEAKYVAWHIRHNLTQGQSVLLPALDDRYLMYIGYTYLQAYQDGLDDLSKPVFNKAPFVYFAQSGICRYQFQHMDLIANLKKGGALVMTSADKRWADAGLVVEKEGKKFFSGYIHEEASIVAVSSQGFEVQVPLRQVKENQMTPLTLILLNAFQMTLGRFPAVRQLLKKFLRKKMILKHAASGYTLVRKVGITSTRITITDTLKGIGEGKVLLGCGKISFVYVPSCRYAQVQHMREGLYQQPSTGASGDAVFNREIEIR